MKNNKKKVFISTIFLIVFVLLLQLNVYADDNRTVISTVTATSNYLSQATYGAEVDDPTFTLPSGAVYRFALQMGNYFKRTDSGTVKVSKNGQFSSGTYFYRVQIRIDGDNGKTYKFANEPVVKINGTKWTVSNITISDTYSCFDATSPDFTIAPGTELLISMPASVTIPLSYVGQAITTIDMSTYTEGGTKPYTFSKASGPNWINVSSAGVISGTPQSGNIGLNSKLTVRVTDKKGNYKEVTISVGKTVYSKDDKYEIKLIDANSNYLAYAYAGESAFVKPNFWITNYHEAKFSDNSTFFYKVTGDGNVRMNSGSVFEKGTYYLYTQIRLDDDAGYRYKFANKDTMKVKVNGTYWEVTSVNVYDEYSMLSCKSPYIAVDGTPATKCTITFDSDGGTSVASQTVLKDTLIKEPSDPRRSGYTFEGWYKTDGYLFDFTTRVQNSFTLVAHWEEKPVTTYWVKLDLNDKAYGEMKIDDSGWSYSLGRSIQENNEYTIQARPFDGYRFVKWEVRDEFNGEVKQEITTSTYTCKAKKAQYYKAIFEKVIPNYTINVELNNSSYGRVRIDSSSWGTNFSQTIQEGVNFEIEAKPYEGYEFVRWEVRDSASGGVNDTYTTPVLGMKCTKNEYYKAIFKEEEIVEADLDVFYQVKIKNEGDWKTPVFNGETAMRETAGNLQQAMKIWLGDTTYSGSIEYRVHLENVGWMEWKKDGEVAGIENTSLRTEALEIRLTGELESKYDVYYRTHIQDNGWMSWAKNGESSGSSGAGLRIEGLQIKIVKKSESAPSYSPACDKSYPFHEQVNVIYMGHIENKGDVGTNYLIRNGITLGYPNQHLRMEGLKIFKESTTPGTIEYTTHVQNVGWLNEVDGKWNTSGEFSGRKGQGLRVEGIKIRLTDELASKYSVYYRVKVENQSNWQGWAKDGEEAGSMNHGLKLEAIQIKILVHGDPNEGNYKPVPDPMLK